MSLVHEFLDHGEKYITTCLDFIRLRPRRFLEKRKTQPERYAKPFQFLILSMILIYFITLAGTPYPWLHSTQLFDLSDDLPIATRVAAKTGTLLVWIVLYSTLLTIILKLWPIKKGIPLLSVIQFFCYAIIFPILWLVVEFFIAIAMGTEKSIANLTQTQLLILGSVFCIYFALANICWYFPGLAAISGSTTMRVCAGFVIWFGGLLAAIVAALELLL